MELIKNKDDLISYLTTKRIASKSPPSSVMVTTKLRRIVLTDVHQGAFILHGMHRNVEFKSIGGGVYKAFISASFYEETK